MGGALREMVTGRRKWRECLLGAARKSQEVGSLWMRFRLLLLQLIFLADCGGLLVKVLMRETGRAALRWCGLNALNSLENGPNKCCSYQCSGERICV